MAKGSGIGNEESGIDLIPMLLALPITDFSFTAY